MNEDISTNKVPDVQDVSKRSFLESNLLAGAVIAAVLVFLVYIFLFDKSSRFSVDVEPEILSEVGTAQETYYQDRDYEGGIRELEVLLGKASAEGPDNEALVKLTLAAFKWKTNRDEVFALLAEVFNNQSYGPVYREMALTNAMWYAVNSVSRGEAGSAYIKQHVFNENRFNILGPGMTLDTRRNFIEAIIYGFEMANDINPSFSALMAAARYYGTLLPTDLSQADPIMVEKMTTYHAKALPDLLKVVDASKDIGAYSDKISYALSNRFQGVLFYLVLLDKVTPEEFYGAGDDMLEYVLHFKSSSYIAEIFAAQASFKYVCGIGLLEEKPLSEEKQIKIKGLLENLYSLNDEDARDQLTIAGLAAKKGDKCYDVVVYVAKNVDPRLKTFLIERVGGWTEENFE